MTILPNGTVTFLFTDIEGSTRLWEQHPEAMKHALARHDALLRQAIEAHAGYVFKLIGDAFCAAFHTAPQALAAALAAQRALQAEPWGATGAITVRMALHTGVTELRDGDYVGPALNRISRLLSAGHGGQMLLSAATQELVRDDLPAGVRLRDLGQLRLRDLTRPEQVYQLEAPELPADFPPLKTLEQRRTNLPVQPTALIGRERELAQLTALLRQDGVRLVTLTGFGGMGKTRLALQVAAELLDDYREGVFFVDLAPISDPLLVLPTIAQTLGLKEAGQQPLQSLKDYLGARRLLLLLDNFEQLVAGAGALAELLRAAPGLKLLVTSRIVLRLRGEREFAVPPLALPDLRRLPPLERLTQYEAVGLFIERARAVKADFAVTNTTAPVIAEICHRLDGLPLAIELAAARIRVLPLEQLLQRLGQRLRLLTGGARDLPQRQQTLRAAIDWSYQLLNPAEQQLFRCLGVFAGGCTLEAVEAVYSAGDGLELDVLDGLAGLAERNLLRQQEARPGGQVESRFVLLETLREYALEQLEQHNETLELQQRHAAFYRTLVQQAAQHFHGPHQLLWFDKLDQDHANLRVALEWLLTQGQPEQALALAADLYPLWYTRGYLQQGRTWLERCLAAAPAAPLAVRAVGLRGLGVMLVDLGAYAQAETAYQQSQQLFAALGDARGVSAVLNNLGIVARLRGNYAAAQQYLEQALQLARQQNAGWQTALILMNLGRNAIEQQHYDRALAYLEESSTRYKELGDGFRLAASLHLTGTAQLYRGNFQAAGSYLEQAMALYTQVGAHYVNMALAHTGLLALLQQDHERAQALLRQGLAMVAESGDHKHLPYHMLFLGYVAAAAGQPGRAARLLASHEALRERLMMPLPPMDQPFYTQVLEQLRDQLDQATLETLWAEGRAMPLDEVMAYALGAAETEPGYSIRG